ncbi:MAG TPA: glycine cleavage system aminomethyltransferase GcvT [Chitinophagales bacterium]|jgi:aminomethyltransferase|nr:glycine cleavage system aminomethyltransferase GcvT [Chitinophagales bacterium]MBP6154126.1 glycine cleavage system aminomethyltransferase GcvT [Chitinophagales bacterium]HQV77002.1 glycine cleavage system aminomethyltransferase GcvT [Chitinophagales bacterium]HQW77931.1 glycine cleavage system aminomethyltransferase GcvT [Chitinophagales bacterium]HRB66351.1 glycine cleavage system aminomethyltransferase GcvT [Chitinophagales bacterium]
MKTTPLTDTHIALGAKMVDFAGFNMPVRYTSDLDEHHCVRNGVGMFDVSHMGEFILKGENALPLLQKIISNDVSKLERGQAQYAYLPNEKGGIVDDLLVYHLEDGHYMCVVNAGNIEKDWAWFNQHNMENAELHNISDKTALLAIQGPKAKEVMQTLTEIDLDSIPYYRFIRGVFAGVENVIISNTGYTGAGGFEIYFSNIHATEVWNKIIEAGKPFGLQPIGLGARDTLRLEKGFCLYGNDIDDNTSPLEAGLGWVTKYTKDFIAKDILLKQKEIGLQKKLVGFIMVERGIPRGHYLIKDAQGNEIGQVTSGTQSPTLGYGVGLGYVAVAFSSVDSEIYIDIRGKLIKAKVVKTPFL